MKRILLILLLLAILTPLTLLGVFVYQVIREAETRIASGAIEQVIASETPVYYNDGQTPIGVFFEKTHRKHIRYQEIPKSFVKALIATEDKHFFEHSGFDLKAIVRSMVANIQAGRVVQGGSTLTQQTAKNVFKREKRSYQAKFKELIQACLLERRYTKQEILEMYANQFFVTGYGKGLQIASNYFFGKDARDLDLVEAAFIVGSVKGPNRYNPFIKKSQVEKEEARALAKARKDYVLANMLGMDFISEREYQKAKNRPVPFKEGQITYRLNVILDYVREQLESPYFKDILENQGIENIATAGLSIYTSVDQSIQDSALNSLRSHLPVMDVKLNGYDPLERLADWEHRLKDGLRKPNNRLPFLAEITHVDKDGENSRLVVTWDNGGGVIDYEGFKDMGEAWLKGELGPRKEFDRTHAPVFLKNFHKGDLVPVRLAQSSDSSPRTSKDLALRLTMIPELEGGIVVLHQGMVTAMAGGFFDRHFNRAVDAKRQVGSIFKPIVYAAALELKWNLLDALKNQRDLFQYENTAYIPRPDHEPKSDIVSLAWAGIKSENLATVWLLYHLTDHLNMGEFRELTQVLGLARKPQESYRDYKKRIRDRYGVLVNKEALMQAAFDTAKRQVRTDLIFSGQEGLLEDLNRLQFDIDPDALDMEKPEVREIARFSFRRLQRLAQNMRGQLQRIRQIMSAPHTSDADHSLTRSLRHFYRTLEPNERSRIVYTERPEALGPRALVQVSPQWIREHPLSTDMAEQISIDDLLPAGTISLLSKALLTDYRGLLDRRRYSLDILSRVRDFKTLVNLSFVVHVSKRIGISTDLDPVLSFPLGPNAISIMETAIAYETLLTSRITPLSPPMNASMVPIIQKIVDRQGKIIYEYRPEPRKALSPRVSRLITEVLEKVMTWGTGRKAKGAVRVFDVPVPTFGKTGTANRFTNSSFVGMVPGLNRTSGRLAPENGYVIAAYVGYDDNRPMKGKHLNIYGASGALPLWMDTANAVAASAEYRKGLEPADVAFGTLLQPPAFEAEMKEIPVSPVTGLPIPPYTQADPSHPQIRTEAEIRGNALQLKRVFDPWPRPEYEEEKTGTDF